MADLQPDVGNDKEKELSLEPPQRNTALLAT